ncbi:UDP pyrophosphate synthase [Flavobacterium akiainvivens]|uniref:Isoprenyl transferase n=1 Tax=Flavobacterium akiainvivens TaxID=1202724 RepID=A0A0M9VJ75_9FLAO|nr:isoprenyl transferase [Flavobacterium akiainvivens]KOS07450.1 UDP pyrophosphate synthase [Flavobacterium akiainvivens]SFQ63050.1 undecaprenyl diphosphate synthase [Flavobacterium akiainvivens]
MDNTTTINKDNLPQHIAIIMDGNGRWAKQKGMLRAFGHENGVKSVRTTVTGCAKLGIGYLTLYAFSTENWNRPKLEVDALMTILMNSLKKELPIMQKNNIRLNTIGNADMLPNKPRKQLFDVIDATKDNTGMVLTLALSYGSREEILQAVKQIAQKVLDNQLNIADISESDIQRHLYTSTMPDADLVIRTSGEQRISNFLLWQAAYAELYFTDVLWPDFTEGDLHTAIASYQKRERRFGKTSEQIK